MNSSGLAKVGAMWQGEDLGMESDSSQTVSSDEDSSVYYFKKYKKNQSSSFVGQSPSLSLLGSKRKRTDGDFEEWKKNRRLERRNNKLQKQVFELQTENRDLKARLDNVHKFVETLTDLPLKVTELLEGKIITKQSDAAQSSDQNVMSDMVQLWPSKFISRRRYEDLICVKGSLRAFTNALLRVLYPPSVLANYSLTGRTCNAKKDAQPKPQLPDVHAVIDFIASKTDSCKKDVRSAITTLLNTESRKDVGMIDLGHSSAIEPGQQTQTEAANVEGGDKNMVQLWSGKLMTLDNYVVLRHVKGDLREFTNRLLHLLYPPAVLANSSVTGNPSDAHISLPAKQQLPDAQELIAFIANETCSHERDVRLTIMNLLNLESNVGRFGGSPSIQQDDPTEAAEVSSFGETSRSSEKEGMVQLWSGRFIEVAKYGALQYMKERLGDYTGTLLRALYAPAVLASCSLTGKASPCFLNAGTPTKPQLPDVHALINFISSETSRETREVRAAIRAVLSAENARKSYNRQKRMSFGATQMGHVMGVMDKLNDPQPVQSRCGDMLEIWGGKFIERWKHNVLMQMKEDLASFTDVLLHTLHTHNVLEEASRLMLSRKHEKTALPDLPEMTETIEYIMKETNHDPENVKKAIISRLTTEFSTSPDNGRSDKPPVRVTIDYPDDVASEPNTPEQDNQVEMVELWQGRFIEKGVNDVLKGLKDDVRKFTNLLLRTLHSRSTLASSSVSGKACTAHLYRGVAAKPQLPDVSATIVYIANQTNEDIKTAKDAIRSLLNTESKRRQAKLRNSDIPVVKELSEWDDEAMQAFETAQENRRNEYLDLEEVISPQDTPTTLEGQTLGRQVPLERQMGIRAVLINSSRTGPCQPGHACQK